MNKQQRVFTILNREWDRFHPVLINSPYWDNKNLALKAIVKEIKAEAEYCDTLACQAVFITIKKMFNARLNGDHSVLTNHMSRRENKPKEKEPKIKNVGKGFRAEDHSNFPF